ncbi:MAG: ankyrin repeat domain-containing protein [Pseudomonadota bacterium]|jgi:hypothetical protein|nr:ankyrin repeat domain-containing protein [Pseudomonadota bacterium]MEC9235360.1 ankyrin repeat domain-containing protein [Pseudomonadota bacterium]MED5422485.1 ankyrin repeat domain-containing protein [Pseudomonadota bacterium]MEE3322937.1 ankyrin repeat domain-containing protein [Pseudomonadota bacterium]
MPKFTKLQKVFTATAVAMTVAAGTAYNAITDFQGTGINKAPIKVAIDSDGIHFLKLPRQLDIAVKANDLKKAEELLIAGANPNLTTHFSGPALNDSTEWGAHLDMMKLLVKYKADVNTPNNAGTLPLTKVIWANGFQGSDEAFEYLLGQGADPDLIIPIDNQNMSPRDWVEHKKADNLQKILERYDQQKALATQRKQVFKYTT